MKRGMAGGAYRAPVGVRRQRRTIRFVQGLLVVMAASLLLFAGYSSGRASGIDRARAGDDLEPVRKPPVAQTVVLTILGLGTFGAALILQTDGGVRLPTPARLRSMEDESAPGPAEETPEGTPEGKIEETTEDVS